MLRSRFVAALGFATLTFAPGAGFAQSDADKATARQLAEEGQAAFDARDFTKAVDRFTRADALFHAPTLVLALARSEAALGHYVAAQEAYNRVIRDVPASTSNPSFKRALSDAKKEVEPIGPKIGWLTVTLSDAEGARVELDGFPFPSAALGVKRAADPGDHTLRAFAAGYEETEKSVRISEGASETVSIFLRPQVTGPLAGQNDGAKKPTDGSSTGRTLAFTALAIGGVGLAAGGATGMLTMRKHDDLAQICAPRCPMSAANDLDRYHLLGTISTASFITGGVGIAAGAFLFLSHSPTPPSEHGFRALPYVGLDGFGAMGAF